MRPSIPRSSEMPGGKAYMGWWGDMGGLPQKRIIAYAQTPFKQKAMHGALTGYIFNGYKRAASHFPYVIVPFSLGYFVYTWAKKYDAWQSSKEGHLALAHKGGEH